MSVHPLYVREDLVGADILMPGEVQLIVPEQTEEKTKWQLITRFSSVGFHILVFVALLFQSKLFPAPAPTQAELALAHTQMTVLLPPGALEAPKPSTPSTRPSPPAPR